MSLSSEKPRPPSRSKACERLVLSRERLRQALLPAAQRQQGSAGSPVGFDWHDLFKSVPGAPDILQALRMWWAQSPANTPARMALAAMQSMVQPFAQRHPFVLLWGSMVIGAAVMATRPWRWLPQAALRSGLWAGIPGLLAAVVSRWPVHTWLDVLSAALKTQGQPQSSTGGEQTTAQRPVPTPAPPPGSVT